MNEYTVVTTIQFTDIIRADDFDQEKYKKNFVVEISDPFDYYFDKIELKSCKVFPREVEEDG